MNQSLNQHILLLGEALIDFISEEIVDSLEFANKFEKFPGGAVANLASNLARLGFQSSLASCIGDDGFTALIRHYLGDSCSSTPDFRHASWCCGG